MDLISLDSPFMTEAPASTEESHEANHDFEQAWETLDKLTSRGWCEEPIEAVVRKLQTLQCNMSVLPADQGPFQGEWHPSRATSDSCPFPDIVRQAS